MKKIIVLLAFMAISSSIFAKSKGDSLGLPGDHLDLYAALDLFKESDNPEAFEKALNDPAKGINNLDLNNDGEIDYIKVIDKGQGDARAFVLQVPINETESQDVAVVEVEKSGTNVAHVQIVGDEDLYGKDYIVEPVPEKPSSSSSSARPVHSTVIVNVWHWRPVKYIYGPHYVFWTSPWRWHHYPAYWNPWHPVQLSIYYKKAHHFHYAYYHRTVVYHVNTAHKVYYKQRITSVTYHEHKSAYQAQHANKAAKQKSPSHIKGHNEKKTKKADQK